MKNAVYAASLLSTLAAAKPQGPPGGFGPNGMGPFAAFPSCVSSCWQDVRNSATGCSAGDYSCLCTGSAITAANSCIESSSCSDSEKDDTYQAIAQLCANADATVTASPEATWSATSGGAAWPSGWTTNSAWASVTSKWGGNGPIGWSPGQYGPFGQGRPGHGWGPWASESTGAWTTGAWTSWWGTDDCPASTWSGWTNGPWSTDAPWTTWAGCTASTTATAVVTSTVTGNGTSSVTTSTSFGIQVAQATNGGSAASSSTSPGAAMATNMKMVGSAAGMVGVVAGALLL